MIGSQEKGFSNIYGYRGMSMVRERHILKTTHNYT